MVTVSVIIPYYNRVQWVPEALDSVLNQTLKDLEIIIVDDGSTEKIDPIIIAQDSRIKYIYQENKGPAAARNNGILHSDGKYIAFLDSDDVFLPHKLEKQVAFMETHPDIGMTHTSYIRMNDTGEFLEEMESGEFTGDVYPQIILGCPIATPTVMIRREVLNDLAFEESIRIGEDIILWTRIAKKYKINGIPEAWTKVRIHQSNTALDPQSQLSGNKNILKYATKYDPSLGLKFKLKAMATLYLSVSYMYRLNGNYLRAILFLARGVIVWPPVVSGFFTKNKLKRLILAAIPDSLMPVALRIWKLIKNAI